MVLRGARALHGESAGQGKLLTSGFRTDAFLDEVMNYGALQEDSTLTLDG